MGFLNKKTENTNKYIPPQKRLNNLCDRILSHHNLEHKKRIATLEEEINQINNKGKSNISNN